VTSAFHRKSISLFLNENHNLFTTTKNISEFFAVCTKLNLDFEKMLGFYADIKENFTILKPSDQSLDIFEMLIRKYKPHGNRVYDIEIVSIMLANEIKKVVTANISDFSTIDEIELIEIERGK
jgi:predicted nucleic acid-binding protein